MTGKMKEKLIELEENNEAIAGSDDVKLMRSNLERLERISTCLRRQVIRLGGDPTVCTLEEKSEQGIHKFKDRTQGD